MFLERPAFNLDQRNNFALMKSLLAILFLFLTANEVVAIEYFVSPSGSDSNSGTIGFPFATITKARDTIRALKSKSGLPKGGIIVWLRGGYYDQSNSIVFDARDSGTKTSPIVYNAWPGEQPFITGARPINPSWFTLVDNTSNVWARLDPAARGKVYCANLRNHGITNYGFIKAGGFHTSSIAPLELFNDGRPMTLARWPNTKQTLAYTTGAPSRTQITYADSRPERWSQAQNVWLHGLWNTSWADFHMPVASIDQASKAINFSKAPQFGLGANRPYYAYNLLEELDEPGEYYMDQYSGILYFMPTSPLANGSLQVSILEDCLIQLNDTRYIILRNITLEASRGPLLQINSGAYNLVTSCLLRNGGEYAARIGGTCNGLDLCNIYECGEDGVLIYGGTRSTLVSGNNYVTNCRFSRLGRLNWTYHPAINLVGGCGNIASHNLIEELPHTAVLFSGNNHVIEYNEIRRVCLLTSDAGAIYAGRDWGYRGNIIRFNYIHHLQSTIEGLATHGVYLDDLMSGVQIFGNVFYRISGAAVCCGGGRDNIISNNLIGYCDIGHYNGDYARNAINHQSGDSFNLLDRLAAEGIQYQKEPWLTSYPECSAIPNSWPLIQQGLWRNPENCVFSNNAGWSNAIWTYETNNSKTGVFAVYASMHNNNPSLPPLFDENASWDRSLRPVELTAGINDFNPIPFKAIGPALPDSALITQAPPACILTILDLTSSQIDLQWTNAGGRSSEQATRFELQRQTLPDGPWQRIQSFGPDAGFARVTGLAPATNYAFRVWAFNAIGTVHSMPITVNTLPAPLLPGITARVEAEIPLNVLKDIGHNGSVGLSKATLVSGQCVRLFDPGDTIRINFAAPSTGMYLLAVRVRSGGANIPVGTLFWPDGYHFSLDDKVLSLKGTPSTVSALEQSFGPTYWGTMSSTPLALSAGQHYLDVISDSNWAAVDYLEITPLLFSR